MSNSGNLIQLLNRMDDACIAVGKVCINKHHHHDYRPTSLDGTLTIELQLKPNQLLQKSVKIIIKVRNSFHTSRPRYYYIQDIHNYLLKGKT